MIELVIFDLDGVLVDACEWHRLALNQALKEVSGYEISERDHHETFNGIPTKVKLQRLSKMGVVSYEDHERVYNLKQKLTIKLIKEKATLRKEKIEMINFLKSNDCKVACFTNSIRETATLMLEKTGVLNQLDHLLTNEDVEKTKPDPEGYIFLINLFKVKKENVIIIEDSPKGLKAAHASGCNVVKVANPDFVTKEIFKEYFK
jgi:HAD superfamily hydrolase (TIGR01509 family)